MRNKIVIIVIFFLLSFFKGFSQNVKIEIVDYSKNIEGIEYSTYQYANASYSYSRPPIIFITDKVNFMKIYQKIPTLYLIKQEYTDVFILGINEFNNKKITEINKKIINEFLENIVKFRVCFNLPVYNKDEMYNTLNYIDKQDNLCNYLSCRNKALKIIKK